MTDVSGNVEAISTYTIGATGTIPLATFAIFAAQAAKQIVKDDPGNLLDTDDRSMAQAYYVCHLIAQKKGQVGKTSLSIGKYSYSKTLATGMTSWLDGYRDLLKGIQDAPVDLGTCTDGITREDAEMPGLGLDQSIRYNLDDEVRTN
jgi:hypothetical protein